MVTGNKGKGRHFVIGFLITLIVLFAVWVRIRYLPAYNGVVLQYESDEPVENAEVIAVYKYWTGSPGGEVPGYLAHYAVKADKEGRFTIPGRLLIKLTFFGGIYPYARLNIYFPGYGNFPGVYKDRNWRMFVEFEDKGLKNPPSVEEVVYRLPKLRTPEDRKMWGGYRGDIHWIPLDERKKLQ